MRPPIPFSVAAGHVTSELDARRITLDDPFLARLRSACSSVLTDPATLAEASRDWWPLAMTWALDGRVGRLAAAVAIPESVAEVAAVLALCNDARIPVTAAGGRSGVSGGSIPLHGGVVLDLGEIAGIVDVDDVSLVVDVRAGTFGSLLEDELRADHRATLGHWPQSIELSTVGGWLACRSAGQLSTRYGKIEDMVAGLDAVLADGTVIRTGGAPRAAAGPDLTQVFVGSEGTLGIITGARLRLHPAPSVDACRGLRLRVVPRRARGVPTRRCTAARPQQSFGSTTTIESDRHFSTGETIHVLLVLDEGEPAIVDGGMRVVARRVRRRHATRSRARGSLARSSQRCRARSNR